MTLDELKAKLPEPLLPWVEQYGPAFLAMAGAEIQAWIDKLIRGDLYGAYADVFAKMDNPGRAAEWADLESDWKKANTSNAESMSLQKSALVGVLKICLTIALASVGL